MPTVVFVRLQKEVVMDGIVYAEGYPIKPGDIDISKHFWGAFGSVEREISARWIVSYCQDIGNWGPFTEEGLQMFYRNDQKDVFKFNGLEEEGLITRSDGKVFLSHRFVAQCFLASPAIK